MVRPKCGQSINGHVWQHTPRQRRRCGASSGFLRLGEMKASSLLAPVETSRYIGKPSADNRKIRLNREEMIPKMLFLLVISSHTLVVSLYLIPVTFRQIAQPPTGLTIRNCYASSH